MAITKQQFEEAEARSQALRDAGHVVSARFDHDSGRIIVDLSTGVQIAFPAALAEGLSSATAEDLAVIEISPTGLGLHWPRIDADVYVPALLEGFFGSKRWMAEQLGRAGGRSRSAAKRIAARQNGLKGGRPKKQVV